MTIYLDDDDVSSLLPLKDAISCTDRAFRLLADASAVNEVRHRSRMRNASLNVMWSIAPTEGVLGVKAYPVIRRDVTQGAVLTLLLYSIDTGQLLAIVKADRLGQLRTGAASAVATRTLARPDAETLAIYGTGFQAEFQLRAITAVLPMLRSVLVVGRSPARQEAFMGRLRMQLEVDIRSSDGREAAEAADVLVTATGSMNPVVEGDWLTSGTHINAVGSNVGSKREIDRAVLDRAALIAVDDRAVARQESGDLIVNQWDQSDVVTLGDILTRRAKGRRSADDVTVFESQGLALQDVTCAALVYTRAVEYGRGKLLTGEESR